MTTKKSREELNEEYGETTVSKSLRVERTEQGCGEREVDFGYRGNAKSPS